MGIPLATHWAAFRWLWIATAHEGVFLTSTGAQSVGARGRANVPFPYERAGHMTYDESHLMKRQHKLFWWIPAVTWQHWQPSHILNTQRPHASNPTSFFSLTFLLHSPIQSHIFTLSGDKTSLCFWRACSCRGKSTGSRSQECNLSPVLQAMLSLNPPSVLPSLA